MKPNYEIIKDCTQHVLIRDVGPWDRHLTVTNGAEAVVAELAGMLGSRRLFYIDSEGDIAELVHHYGKFSHFEPNRP